MFLLCQSVQVEKVSYDINDASLAIRDPYDKPVLRAALQAKCDILITGDKDFLESDIAVPQILKAKDFLTNF